MRGDVNHEQAGRRSFLRTAAALAVAGFWRETRATPPCSVPPTEGDLDRLRRAIGGDVVYPSDRSYDALRLIYERRFQYQPLAIVRPTSSADVAYAIDWARNRGMVITPRSGGHSYIGAGCSDGIVIDLGLLDGIQAVDEDGLARIGAGAQLGALERGLHCQADRRLPSGTCPTVGIGGIALGGGHGYVTRRHGLTCDRLREATVVMADGRVVKTSADRERDLFWALRGGGGGLGIVTEMRFETVPSTQLSLARIEVEADAFIDGFEAFESVSLAPPSNEVSFFASIDNGDPDADLRFRISVVVPDEPSAASALLESLLPSGLPTRGAEAFEIPLPSCNASEAAGGEWARRKSAMPRMPIGPDGAEVMRTWFAARRRDPSLPQSDPARIAFNGYGGAVALVPRDATAFPHRDALYSVQMSTVWNASSSPQTVTANADWIRGLERELRPHLGPGCYYNYADEDLEDWAHAYWLENLPRLRSVKRAVDPFGVLRGRQWVVG